MEINQNENIINLNLVNSNPLNEKLEIEKTQNVDTTKYADNFTQ